MRYFSLLNALPLALAAPFVERDDSSSSAPSRYIVVLKSDAEPPQHQSTGPLPSTHIQAGAAVASIPKDLVYHFGTFKGFAAPLNDAQIAALKQDSSVGVPPILSDIVICS